MELNLGEEDWIFLRLLLKDISWFELELSYEGDTLQYAVLDGKKLESRQFQELRTTDGKSSADFSGIA